MEKTFNESALKFCQNGNKCNFIIPNFFFLTYRFLFMIDVIVIKNSRGINTYFLIHFWPSETPQVFCNI